MKLDLRWRFSLAAGAVGGLMLAIAIACVFGVRMADGAGAYGAVAGLWAAGTAALAASFYWIAARLLSPAERIADEARHLSWGSGGLRLPVPNPHDEFGRLADAFNTLLARFDESLEETGRFAADASHELRTPLAALRSIGEVAATSESSDASDLRESLGAMLEQVERMSRLVEDLLLLTRRGDGSATDEALREVPLDTLLEEVAQTYAVLAEEKRQSLALRCEPGLSVLARPEALGIAVANLLQNAIRHSPPGTAIRVTARASELAVTLEIADQGPGIPREHHANVFAPFYRIDPSRSRQSGGSGLGLAIAKRCVESCGGEIGLRSSPGSGSVFFLCLRKAGAPT